MGVINDAGPWSLNSIVVEVEGRADGRKEVGKCVGKRIIVGKGVMGKVGENEADGGVRSACLAVQ